MKPTQACWWKIGVKNKSQAPAVAVDLHGANGELIGETWAKTCRRGEFRKTALAFAKRHGIGARQVHYDPDSTNCMADC